MSHEMFTLEELSRHLGRDRREIEKLASRGRIPGRKVGSAWQFHSMEITRWLEHEMREYSSAQLRDVEVNQRSEDVCSDLPVTSILDVDTVQVPLKGKTRRSVLEELVEVAGRTWQVWSPSEILKAVQDREELLATAYPGGVAIPHPRNPLPNAHGQSIVAFGRSYSGIPFGAAHGGMTDLFFLVLCIDTKSHLQIVARLGRMLQLPEFLDQLRDSDDAESTYAAICAADEVVSQQDRVK